ncbi:hypothetical protein Y603_1013 [Burkholderia pseudomallei MSHR1153]|uniref:hypothetical protein n=1 Tax=Burkholderia pseudomallei TaxID=28450 RepID=UPI00052A5F3C|nr:hypothetical protein [Burkholderia pseudomallei]AIV50196.1 hypothetical protein Y603_1013 [Burkholderia pseudomallei MSHR1153]
MKKSEVIGAAAMANESAALTLLRRVYTGLACAALTQIPNGERLWDEIGEYLATRAAASPGAEAVALTDEGIIQLFEEKADVDLEVYHGIAASTVLSFARALLAAPQPAQADAPAHAAECPHCDGEGVIEGDSGTSPCACQRDVQEGMPTFGPRKVQADEEELKMLQIFPLTEVAGRYWIGLGEDGRMYSGEVYWVKTGHDHPAHQQRIAWKVITGAIGEAWK